MTTQKYKQIPKSYYIAYFISVVNILCFATGYLYFDLSDFYTKIGIPKTIILIILFIEVLTVKWSNNLVTKELKNDIIALKVLKTSISIKFLVSIILIFSILYPYLEINHDLNNKLTLFFGQYLPTLATKFYIDIIKPILGILLSGLVLLLQKIIVTPIYDYLIKPKIEKVITKYQKKDKEKQ